MAKVAIGIMTLVCVCFFSFQVLKIKNETDTTETRGQFILAAHENLIPEKKVKKFLKYMDDQDLKPIVGWEKTVTGWARKKFRTQNGKEKIIAISDEGVITITDGDDSRYGDTIMPSLVAR